MNDREARLEVAMFALYDGSPDTTSGPEYRAWLAAHRAYLAARRRPAPADRTGRPVPVVVRVAKRLTSALLLALFVMLVAVGTRFVN